MSGTLRIGVVIGLVLVSLPLVPAPGQGQQEFSVYENWSGARIRGDRWRGGEASNGQEVVREIASAGAFGNYLSMSLRREGERDSNIGSRTSSTFLNFANPASIVQIEALMGVLDVLVERCPANDTPSEARFLIAMTAFNDGSSPGGANRTGDYNAVVQAVRRSNSADQPGILRVEGRVTRCRNAPCSAEDEMAAPRDLGSLAVGVPFTMRLIWDAPNNRFLAGVNTSANVPLPYLATDAQGAVQRSAGIEIRNSTANCTAGATEADLDGGVGPVGTAGSPPVVPPTPPVTPPPFPPPPFPPPPFPPPPVTPPPVTPPPVTPPPVTPPPVTPPPGDNSPFTFPAQPPYNPTDPSARYSSLGPDPAGNGNFYAALAEYANPLPGSHLYAGMLPDGRRLWVHKDAQPAAIRRVLQTGKL